ncbi:MAG TPA: putative motility protein [Holophagaceae bacterium]|nr:putative motility protein [Holophagaceae bacterium]
MEVSAPNLPVTPAAISARDQAQTRETYSASVLRKVIDAQAQQGMALAQMVAEAGGVGQNLNTQA